ncbi:type I-E CRISPR-associated endoribonuclease Cas2e [Kineothrix sp. MB12-C1]|uniref:type I-E CRISPR-associated endoribonuclease Cas2e n=1 Tax=Kineothrix sp. MB12-C1 TaxID=3070215 RepID=UPI0027D2E431|nr:type I-E CRISPR-associated endoribonuclease Cas2e [Kineothrix sp. MB12-C1]WMC93078.1 type I-E CRISPR-associated endoribonuclease Cas2e [Kineothrix sp. MB12-C1]
MPMTVVTLTNVPSSLRGDLTKWMQEISTGVYVGNINTRIREELWKRIIDNIKQGQATMSYAKRNEIGYDFMVHNTKREVIYYDGIPLVFLPKELSATPLQQLGFSNAAKFEKIKRARQRRKVISENKSENYVVIDVETTGINAEKDQIIEIAAVKMEGNEMIVFQELVKVEKGLQREISELTGITDEMLANDGKNIAVVLDEFLDFVGGSILVGYNVKFDISFLNAELKKSGNAVLTNKTICLLQEAKRKQKLLRDYKLSTVLKKYDISTEGLHRAYVDVKAEYELAVKLNIF